MVDSDMVFGPSQFEDLIYSAHSVERPIVGGLCFGGRAGNHIFPTIYRLVDPKENGTPSQPILDYPKDQIVKVDATGAAFLLIHRSVLVKMLETYPGPSHWFSESVYAGFEFGEDWTFCLRAGQLGYPIHVHTGIEIGHVKPRIIGAREFEEQRQ